MTPLSSISGIGKNNLELLEVAGFSDLETLSRVDAAALVAELVKANEVLRISKRPPSLKQVACWIEAARAHGEGTSAVETAPVAPINYEARADVAAMIADAPLAIPLPARQFMEAGVAVSEIPPAIFLNHYKGDLEVRVEREVAGEDGTASDTSLSGKIAPHEFSPAGAGKIGIDVSRLRSTSALNESGVMQVIPAHAPSADHRSLMKAPRESTNCGKSPKSRWFIRGVLANERFSLRLAALLTITVYLLVVASVISVGLLMLSDMKPESFGWVSRWLLVFPALLPPLGILYLFFAPRCSCQICRQKLFWPRHCIKNSKAHHVKGLGYIFPLCFHLLVFRWFRCTYCGTPLRLKE
ncbi:MAG: DUF4332 domain-containing protein [Luteolibacter sp.]